MAAIETISKLIDSSGKFILNHSGENARAVPSRARTTPADWAHASVPARWPVRWRQPCHAMGWSHSTRCALPLLPSWQATRWSQQLAERVDATWERNTRSPRQHLERVESRLYRCLSTMLRSTRSHFANPAFPNRNGKRKALPFGIGTKIRSGMSRLACLEEQQSPLQS